MDTRFYLDVNRFARRTPWLHGFAHGYALYGGVIVLVVLVVLACLRARGRTFGANHRRLAAALWAGIGAAVALGINQPIAHAIGRRRPYAVLRHVEVLVPRAHDFTMPSDHATVAGAIAVGLWIARDRLLAAIATVLALLLAFMRVYVGAHYPSDVLVGLVIGGVIVGLGSLFAIAILQSFIDVIGRSPLQILVGPAHHAPPVELGADAQPTTKEPLSGVRILEERAIAPRASSNAPRPERRPTFSIITGPNEKSSQQAPRRTGGGAVSS